MVGIGAPPATTVTAPGDCRTLTGMKVGVVLPIAQDDWLTAVPSYPEVREIALAVEANGFDSLWIYDHLLFRFEPDPTSGIHEAWTVLSAVAEATNRVELGTLVMCTEFRNPGLLAKMAATLDAVSGGRLILGLGCGWHDPEYEAFGYPTDHKVGRFEDSLTIIRELIREGRSSHQGIYHSVDDAVLLPPARPDLPILIAGKRPRMLDLVARHADQWNLAWFAEPDARLATTRAELAAACERAGRAPGTLGITVGINVRYADLLPIPVESLTGIDALALEGTADEIAAGLAAHAAAGADHVIVALQPTTPEAVGRLAEAVARFRAG
jgi:probable F420-dependent oxidoreductase